MTRRTQSNEDRNNLFFPLVWEGNSCLGFCGGGGEDNDNDMHWVSESMYLDEDVIACPVYLNFGTMAICYRYCFIMFWVLRMIILFITFIMVYSVGSAVQGRLRENGGVSRVESWGC